MSTVAIHITIEPARGRPVSLARLADADILEQAARTAIAQARDTASRARILDPVLGRFRGEEADRLERYLRLLVPGLSLPPATGRGNKSTSCQL